MFTSEHWRRLRPTSAPDLRFSAGLIAAFAVTLVSCAQVAGVWTNDQNYRVQAVNSLGPMIGMRAQNVRVENTFVPSCR